MKKSNQHITEKYISRNLRERATRTALYTFESCGQQAVPDLHGVSDRRAFWVELKVVDNVQRLIPFRPGQSEWLRDYEEAGGVAFVLILDRETGDFYLLFGKYAHENKKLPVEQFATHAVATLAEGRTCWANIDEALAGPPEGLPF